MTMLTLVSLGLGLVATGVLSLAIVTDFWLYSSEPLDFENMVMGGNPSLPAEEFPPDTLQGLGADFSEMNETSPVGYLPTSIKLHSGLWRVCVYYEGEEGKFCLHVLRNRSEFMTWEEWRFSV